MVLTITTNKENEIALAEAGRLIKQDPEPGTDEANRLVLLASAISSYERVRYPIGKPTLWERIRFRLEQRGWFESR